MKKKLIVLSGLALLSAPFMVLAQTTGGTATKCSGGQITTIQSLICKFNEILGAVLPLLIALGVVFFVWGVISFVIAADEEAKSAGRDKMIYGIIGLAVIVGLWGLVRIVTNTFGINNVTNITLPTVPY
jgi:hypothetical protein